MNEYATYNSNPVQVLDTHTARPECRACGGEGNIERDTCTYCNGTGKESRPVEYATVGLLTGALAGTKVEVRASALRTITEAKCRMMMAKAGAHS